MAISQRFRLGCFFREQNNTLKGNCTRIYTIGLIISDICKCTPPSWTVLLIHFWSCLKLLESVWRTASRCTYLNDICLIKTGQFLRAENIHLQNIKCSSVVTMNNTVIIWRSYYNQKQLFIVLTPTPISYCEYEKCPISKKKLQKLKDYPETTFVRNRSTTCLQIVGNFSVYYLSFVTISLVDGHTIILFGRSD